MQLVADEDESKARAGALAHIAAQLPGAVEVERRRRLVEHDQAHARRRGRARDFNHLPFADRQVVDARVGVDPVSREDGVQCSPGRAAVEVAPAELRARMLRGFDEEVLRDRQRRAQRQFLMDHSDATPLSRAGVVVREGILDPVKRQASQRRRGDPAQDPHERRLAGAVAADQADDVGGGHRKVDVRRGERRSERLGDAREFDQRSRRLDWVRSGEFAGARALRSDKGSSPAKDVGRPEPLRYKTELISTAGSS